MLKLRKIFSPKLIGFKRPTSYKRCLSTKQEAQHEEYTDEAQYPPILDLSYDANKLRKVQSWHEKIKSLNTIEEKLMELNMPRYYGYPCMMLNDRKFPYNSMPFIQYCTRTHFKENLPDFYNGFSEKSQSFLGLIKSDIEEALEFEFSGYLHEFNLKTSDLSEKDRQRVMTAGVVRQLNRILINALAADNFHLYELDVDLDPRHEAFWVVGGIIPPILTQKIRAGKEWTKKYEKDPIDRHFQYIGKPALALRHQFPLPVVEEVNLEEQNFENDKIEVPSFKFDPQTLGYVKQHRHGTTIPGFWPGNAREFGLLCYEDRNYMLSRPNDKYGEADKQEALHSQGILSSYAWLFGQACYQGFSTFNDVTYPLTTQTIVTDGKLWSFYVYQLNTTLVHSTFSDQNPRYNQCWGTKEMKLFENITESGKIEGLNDEVLSNLIKFYVNQPKIRSHEMKPYLGTTEKKISDIEHVQRRVFLEKEYKHLVSNRPRHRLVPEIYAWEKIYKIDNDTKPLVPKRRFFELGINPFKRRLNEHTPVFIPKHLRERGRKDRNKWEPMYYP